jgi:hypothetical protein
MLQSKGGLFTIGTKRDASHRPGGFVLLQMLGLVMKTSIFRKVKRLKDQENPF